MPYLGETLLLRARAGPHARAPPRRHAAGAGRRRRHDAAIERWYRRRAHEEVAPRLDRATALAGTRYTRLTIRGQRTRWASCSTNGAMSFNWRLLLAPAPVLDYVVWHEVCHLEVMDHSPRFWSLLAQRWPDYRRTRPGCAGTAATLVL